MVEKFMQENDNVQDFSGLAENTADIHSEAGQSVAEENDTELVKLRQELDELKDKYLRQVADFDNFRKRNAKERLEIIQTASRDVVSSLLEVLDDCDRAEKQISASEDISSIKEGISLVFSKFRTTMQSKGVRAMETKGTSFNPDVHEAITEIPAPAEELIGKVVDEVEKGYYLNDKIIRFAKVVVGK